jgi:hypothetical protein
MTEAKTPPTSAELNELHQEFWQAKTKEFEERIAQRGDDLRIAGEEIREQISRGVPVRSLPSLEHEVFKLKKIEERQGKARQSRNGRAPRPKRTEENPFHQFIRQRLARNSSATAQEIWAELVDEAKNGELDGRFQFSQDGSSVELVDDPKKSMHIRSFPAIVSRLKKVQI